jgi:hypothetical protein
MHFIARFDFHAVELDMCVQAFPGILDLDRAWHVERLSRQAQLFDHFSLR